MLGGYCEVNCVIAKRFVFTQKKMKLVSFPVLVHGAYPKLPFQEVKETRLHEDNATDRWRFVCVLFYSILLLYASQGLWLHSKAVGTQSTTNSFTMSLTEFCRVSILRNTLLGSNELYNTEARSIASE